MILQKKKTSVRDTLKSQSGQTAEERITALEKELAKLTAKQV